MTMPVTNLPVTGQILFVYGSLRPNEVASLLEDPDTDYLGQAEIYGTLHDLGWYPGVTLGGNSTVHGDLFRIKTDTLSKRLDAYEGYPSLFDRKQTETTEGLPVFVYTYNYDVYDDIVVESGDWSKRHHANT
jgi:gamma-glutamylcyclotransferase (GGCT)/AIG2-like uncharacterized protein YtfP